MCERADSAHASTISMEHRESIGVSSAHLRPRLARSSRPWLAWRARSCLRCRQSPVSRLSWWAQPDPVLRWYEALRQLSGAYRTDFYATETDGTGAIFISRIDDVCATSATLCTVLESLSAVPRRPLEMLAGVPRYAGPYGHWRAAQEKLSANEPDFAGAAREAINAVEGLCRVILGDESLTLGKCLSKMRERGLLDPALAKGLDALWGFASAEPGIRHGAARAHAVRPRDARYVVEANNAALVLLFCESTRGRTKACVSSVSRATPVLLTL